MNRRNLLGHIVIAVVSLAAAFFGVFNVLFSDANGVNERSGAVTFILLGYTILSVFAHWVWPVKGWMWVRWFVAPAFVLGGFYLFKEFSSLSVYGVLILLAVIAGATSGREIMSHKRRAAPPTIPSV